MNPQKNGHYLTLSQAAKATGKSKSVISSALKTGEISYISKDDGGYRIDPAELFRVFPKNDNKNRSDYRSRTHENGVENVIKIKELEAKLEATSQHRDLLKDQLDETKQDRDNWREQAQRLALTHQKPVESTNTVLATYPLEKPLRLSGRQIFGLAAGFILIAVLIAFLPDYLRARFITAGSPAPASAGIQQPAVTIQPQQ